ncbi:MAG: acyltransferase [Bacteroidaceae bacterium]|nr:acyltransferase [Bacteroidaceae bacterium]
MSKRDCSIDVLKFVCAAFIVFLHTNWRYSEELLPVTRFAVPCFFIISGYLLSDNKKVQQERLKRTFRRILSITLWATLFFFVWDEAVQVVRTGSLMIPTAKDIVKWVAFNASPWGFHLWYMYAYLYVLLIVMLVNKFSLWRLLYWFTPMLLLAGLAFGTYGNLLWNWSLPYVCLRSFIFVGLPYFTIGTLLKRHQRPQWWALKQLHLGCIVLFVLTTYLERLFLINTDNFAFQEYFLSTTPLAVSAFLLAIAFRKEEPSFWSRLGEKDSLYIYIIHPVFMVCGRALNDALQWQEAYSCIAPLVVLIATIISIKCLRKMKLIP